MLKPTNTNSEENANDYKEEIEPVELTEEEQVTEIGLEERASPTARPQSRGSISPSKKVRFHEMKSNCLFLT